MFFNDKTSLSFWRRFVWCLENTKRASSIYYWVGTWQWLKADAASAATRTQSICNSIAVPQTSCLYFTIALNWSQPPELVSAGNCHLLGANLSSFQTT